MGLACCVNKWSESKTVAEVLVGHAPQPKPTKLEHSPNPLREYQNNIVMETPEVTGNRRINHVRKMQLWH